MTFRIKKGLKKVFEATSLYFSVEILSQCPRGSSLLFHHKHFGCEASVASRDVPKRALRERRLRGLGTTSTRPPPLTSNISNTLKWG